MGRKVFISVLGTGNYGPGKYQKEGQKASSLTRFIQQATLESIGAENWEPDSLALILLTDGARESNWNDEVIKTNGTKYEGLGKVLRDMNLPFEVRDVPILDGSNDAEMWIIFQKVFDQLEEGDELYFDVTHGFRHLPMFVLVLSNYAKFLKNVVIKSISYGNFENRVKDGEIFVSPIVDLLPLSLLLDWTFAAGQFLDSSNIKQLKALTKSQIQPLFKLKTEREAAQEIDMYFKTLEKVIDERVILRGKEIIESKSFDGFMQKADSISETIIAPLNPVLDKVKNSIGDFDRKENILNGFKATKWCYENGYYQQAITLLEENIFTYVSDKLGMGWKTESERDPVSRSFAIAKDKKILEDENRWKLGLEANATDDDKNKKKEIIKSIVNNDIFSLFLPAYKSISSQRNDFNHAGMSDKANTAASIKSQIKILINDVFTVVGELEKVEWHVD